MAASSKKETMLALPPRVDFMRGLPGCSLPMEAAK
jgi:hypothetical protein